VLTAFKLTYSAAIFSNCFHFYVDTVTDPFTIDIVGNRQGGGTVSESFTIITPSNTLRTYTPSLDFSNLLSFNVNVPAGSGSTIFDNFRISVADSVNVSAPSSLALFALGLLRIAFSRRTK
jgi:hypothetical protein